MRKRIIDLIVQVELWSKVLRRLVEKTYREVKKAHDIAENKKLENRWYASRFLFGHPYPKGKHVTLYSGQPLDKLDRICGGPITLTQLREQIIRQTDAWSATKAPEPGTN